MNRNHLIGFITTAAVLAVLIFALWYLFDIYPAPRQVLPSREARVNEYLALDRWLQDCGIPVRVESSGVLPMIREAKEKQIFIQSSLFRWSDEAVEYLVNWIEDGGTLFLVLEANGFVTRIEGLTFDKADLYDDEPLRLLEEFGITCGSGDGPRERHHDPDSPQFDQNVSFEVSEYSGVLTLKDSDGIIRLVEAKRGKGKLIVSGRPYFLLSAHLGDAPNARLAWAIFGAENREFSSPESGCLFIRGSSKVSGLLGSLWRQGNLSVLLVSVLVLLIIGFWAVLPLFGLVRENKEAPGRPLRERFLAEGRFLKKYGALEYYRLAYVREIKRRLARKEGLTTDDEIESRALSLWGGEANERDSGLLGRALGGRHYSYREFPKMITIFKTILERI